MFDSAWHYGVFQRNGCLSSDWCVVCDQVYAVKKLDSSSSLIQNEQDFLGILLGMARLRHANITELVGYCAEHGQRLLVYQYVNRGTLNDMLHTNDENTKRLTWNARVKIALGAARALE